MVGAGPAGNHLECDSPARCSPLKVVVWEIPFPPGVNSVFWDRMAVVRTSILLAGLSCVLLLASCQPQARPGFNEVETGMSREQVRALLGPPSSTFQRQTDEQGRLLRSERWQYGDNLSTVATGILYSDLPDVSVYAIFFDEEGRVVLIQEPLPIDESSSSDPLHRFQDPVDPAIPSRSR